MKKKGYTLIEIIVVCAIILVLAAIVIPALCKSADQLKNDQKPTDDWVIVLSDSGNQLYNCRQIVTESNGNVKVVLSDGSKLTLSSNNCIVLENASEDLLYAMKRQYVDTTAPEETSTTTTEESQ
jgi:prepilin-type N-terminal cleavage/methylation domain-containing protein